MPQEVLWEKRCREPHLKEMVSSCLRPALSMREAATTVISTFITCTPTLASAAFEMPACMQPCLSSYRQEHLYCGVIAPGCFPSRICSIPM